MHILNAQINYTCVQREHTHIMHNCTKIPTHHIWKSALLHAIHSYNTNIGYNRGIIIIILFSLLVNCACALNRPYMNMDDWFYILDNARKKMYIVSLHTRQTPKPNPIGAIRNVSIVHTHTRHLRCGLCGWRGELKCPPWEWVFIVNNIIWILCAHVLGSHFTHVVSSILSATRRARNKTP